jgi:hypothetical protein
MVTVEKTGLMKFKTFFTYLLVVSVSAGACFVCFEEKATIVFIFTTVNRISKPLLAAYGFLGFQCQDFSTFYRSTLSNPEYM